jgi:MFS family permease
MSRDGYLQLRGPRALDLLNFFVADVQTGFGPFVAVYLTTHKWTQVEIGFALTLGTIVAFLSQIPAGALVDAAQNKRAAASAALIGVIIAALLLAIQPTMLPVMVAQMLHAFSSCVLTPAIAAISLHLVGHMALGERLGRNARYAALGNGMTAVVMGATGAWLSSRAVFLLTAALCVPALLSLLAIGRGQHARRQTTVGIFDWSGLRRLFIDRRLIVFAASVLLFHLSNAAMLPLVGATVTMRAGASGNIIIAACIVIPQAVVALCSPAIGRSAAMRGRRPVLLLGWAALPLRGILLAILPGAWPPIAAQALSGVSGAVFGVMLPLLSADITRGTSHFNLCMGALGLSLSLGAALSTALGGWIADTAGAPMAFACLAMIGVLATLVLWLMMPETQPADLTIGGPPNERGSGSPTARHDA